eukprot:XP_017946358.1 PREDICTED: vomeronasal type-2 receptor 26-like [Xenopus tropicalis]
MQEVFLAIFTVIDVDSGTWRHLRKVSGTTIPSYFILRMRTYPRVYKIPPELHKDLNKTITFGKYYLDNFTFPNCTGEERMTNLQTFKLYRNSPRVHFPVTTMVRAIEALHVAHNQEPTEKPISPIIYRHQLQHYMKKMPLFMEYSQFYEFDEYGNLEIDYGIFNYIIAASIETGELEVTSRPVDSESCFPCKNTEWPNKKRTQCIAKAEAFLSYRDVISMFFSAVSVLSFFITLLILGVFISYRDSPIVRANNRSLSFLLLVSIKLSFLSVFLFLGRPVDITCMLRIITFGITFSIAVSSLLAKTIMVCVAFKATKPGSSWRKWLGVKLSNSVVLFCSSIQIIICMTWLAISPPFQELDIHTSPGTIIIQCNEGSAIGFYSVIGYMGLLAAVSFVLAFLARSLPDSFNEAKYITFSMLLFCSVWITMIPAYLSTKGKNTVCVEIFAILTSSAGLLACIFLPKCYIIMFKPEMNTKKNLSSSSEGEVRARTEVRYTYASDPVNIREFGSPEEGDAESLDISDGEGSESGMEDAPT